MRFLSDSGQVIGMQKGLTLMTRLDILLAGCLPDSYSILRTSEPPGEHSFADLMAMETADKDVWGIRRK